MRFRTAALAASATVIIVGIFGIIPSASAAETSPSATNQACTNDTKSVLSHTWDGATGTVTITLKGDKALCDKLYVAVASYLYDAPDKGQWPQTLSGVVRGSIQNPGDVLTLTAKTVCGQRDAYADYGKEPQPGQTLTAPGKPYEPKFVHNFSKGVNTYGHDNPSSCVTTPSPEPSDTPSESPSDTPTATPSDTPSETPTSSTPTPSQTVPATQPPSSPPATSSIVPPTSTSKPPVKELPKTGGDNQSAGITGVLGALLLLLGIPAAVWGYKKSNPQTGSHH